MLSQRLRDWEHVKHVPPGRLQGPIRTALLGELQSATLSASYHDTIHRTGHQFGG